MLLCCGSIVVGYDSSLISANGIFGVIITTVAFWDVKKNMFLLQAISNLVKLDLSAACFYSIKVKAWWHLNQPYVKVYINSSQVWCKLEINHEYFPKF